MTGAAISVSPFVSDLLGGPQRRGVVLDHRFVRFDQDVVAITAPGTPRMPNGIETTVELATGSTAWIGEGALSSEDWRVTAGPLWEPRPCLRYRVWTEPPLLLQPELLVGRGPGLTPLGDDVLIGFLAAEALDGVNPKTLSIAAAHFGQRTTALSRTLLRLAARGHVPEPVHALLSFGDPGPLLRFGATSGRGIAVGLSLGSSIHRWRCDERNVLLELPFPGATIRCVLHITAEAKQPTLPTSMRMSPPLRIRSPALPQTTISSSSRERATRCVESAVGTRLRSRWIFDKGP